MFSKTVKAALSFGQQLESQGVRLVLPQQSPLGVLMMHSALDNPKAMMSTEEFLGQVDFATMIEGSLSEHQSATLTLVDELAPLVQSHIRMSREIGQSAIALAEGVRKYVESSELETATGQFNIKKDETPSLFSESSILGLLENTTPLVTTAPEGGICSGPRDFETLLGYLVNGNERLDSKFKELVASFDQGWLENVWYGVFSPGLSVASNYAVRNILALPSGERLCVAFASYVIAEKLFKDTPSDALGSLGEFERKAADLRDSMLSIAQGALAERTYQNENKVIALGYRPYENLVIVNGPVYRDWLEKGGSPEMILGSMISGDHAYTADDFSERGDKFLKQWVGYCTFFNAESDARRATFLRSIYRACFTETMGNILPFEEAFRKSHPKFAEECITRAEQALEGMGIDRLSDLHYVCLKLVAGLRFDYTPAYQILQDIDNIKKSSPDTETREAALVAAVNYLSLYMAENTGVATV